MTQGCDALKVLGVEARPDGDDGYELFVEGSVPEPRLFPVFEITLRVAVTAPIERGEVAPEAAEEEAKRLLGAKKGPQPKGRLARWLASEAEKRKGMRWRVRC